MGSGVLWASHTPLSLQHFSALQGGGGSEDTVPHGRLQNSLICSEQVFCPSHLFSLDSDYHVYFPRPEKTPTCVCVPEEACGLFKRPPLLMFTVVGEMQDNKKDSFTFGGLSTFHKVEERRAWLLATTLQ